MNNEHHPHHAENGGFINGLVLGIVIGVAVALLFSTKKGKKLLKVLTDEGLEKISGLEDILQDVIEEEVEEETGDENELPAVEQKKKVEKSSKPVHHEEIKEVVVETAPVVNGEAKNPIQKITTTTRRFFRGTPRRG
jgi:gas vesicle protein